MNDRSQLKTNRIITLKIKFVVLFWVLLGSSCTINTIASYKKAKLSKIVELQTKEIIESELGEDLEYIQKEINLVKKSNSILASEVDSLKKLIHNLKPETERKIHPYYVFFKKSSSTVSEEQIDGFNIWFKNNVYTINDSNLLYSVTGFSDNVGDSLTNVKLAQVRAMAIKNFLITNFCIDSSKISCNSKANVSTCYSNIFRSAEIQLINKFNSNTNKQFKYNQVKDTIEVNRN